MPVTTLLAMCNQIIPGRTTAEEILTAFNRPAVLNDGENGVAYFIWPADLSSLNLPPSTLFGELREPSAKLTVILEPDGVVNSVLFFSFDMVPESRRTQTSTITGNKECDPTNPYTGLVVFFEGPLD